MNSKPLEGNHNFGSPITGHALGRDSRNYVECYNGYLLPWEQDF